MHFCHIMLEVLLLRGRDIRHYHKMGFTNVRILNYNASVNVNPQAIQRFSQVLTAHPVDIEK